jgi:hypothetical protein
MTPHKDLSDSIHGDINVYNVAHGILLKRKSILAQMVREFQRFKSTCGISHGRK